jgi:hypothetical protein
MSKKRHRTLPGSDRKIQYYCSYFVTNNEGSTFHVSVSWTHDFAGKGNHLEQKYYFKNKKTLYQSI